MSHICSITDCQAPNTNTLTQNQADSHSATIDVTMEDSRKVDNANIQLLLLSYLHKDKVAVMDRSPSQNE